MAERDDRERAPLDRDAIVEAAIALADAEGIAALSMRKLAASLGFEVMSLYNHIANKDELLAAMVDAVAAEVDELPSGLPPLEEARALAVATRAAFVRHPWAPDLWLRHMPGPARTDQMEHLLRVLAESGLSAENAHHGFHAVNNHVVGYTLQELGMALPPGDDTAVDARAREYLAGLSSERHAHTIAHVHQHLAGDTSSSFELVLDLILDGLVRLDEER
ncbi:MAG: TetR/AcrR family transcriptional regulator C-terminal domain-containing protein [Actinomycetota bacterium]